jgi:hypothetical protein
MNTKIMALTIATTTFSFALHAQTRTTTTASGNQSTTFGIRAGVNFTNINGKMYDNSDFDGKIKTGFNAGVNAEIPIATDFYVQPGILFTTKGAKNKSNDNIKYRISYLEVPINLLYKPELGSGKLLLGIGPYVAFGVGGKLTNSSGKETDFKFKNSISATEYLTDPYVKRIDFGGNLLAGYELSSRLSAQLNAQLGLVKINPKIEGVTNDHTKWKNTGFGISLGYRFM